MASYFKNPTNGYVEKGTTGWSWLWALLFGPFYFVYKGVWGHALINFFLGPMTLGIVWIVYAFFAAGIVRKNYRQRGWIQVHEPANAA